MAKYKPTLTKETRLKIAKYAAQNPDISADSIADKFRCSIGQARYAIYRGRQGQLKRRSTKGTRNIQAKMLREKMDSNKIFEKQIHFALAQLESDDKLDAVQRTLALERLVRAEKVKTEHEMQLHLKGLDWKTFVEVVKMFKPDAFEKDIIRIFNEAKERCKVSQD